MAEELVTTPDPAPEGRMEDRWALDDIAELVGFHRDAHPAEVVRAVRAEFARFRPVVDAARALVNHPLKPSAHPEFDTLRAWVASLDDGDAAATLQPAAPEAVNADVGALGALIDTLALDVYATAHGVELDGIDADQNDGIGEVRLVLADALEPLRAVLARRTEEAT